MNLEYIYVKGTKRGTISLFLCLFVINLIEFITDRLQFRTFIPTFAASLFVGGLSPVESLFVS